MSFEDLALYVFGRKSVCLSMSLPMSRLQDLRPELSQGLTLSIS